MREIPSPVRDDGWLNCRVVPYGADQKLLFMRDTTERVRLSRMRRGVVNAGDQLQNAGEELRQETPVLTGDPRDERALHAIDASPQGHA